MPRAMDELGRFKCCHCQQWLPKDSFCYDRSRNGNRNSRCKECARISEKNRSSQQKIPRDLDTKQFIKNWKNHSMRELAAIYGRTQSSVGRWAVHLRKLGWDLPYRTARPQSFDRDEFVRLANTMPISDIADKLGLAYNTIVHRITICRKEGYDV